MIKTIVIPDVHGRTFWKDVLSSYPPEKYPDIDIVFLGDYLDPYAHEGISREDAITVFQEIIAAARADKRIILLLGNHDLSYYDSSTSSSRIDRINWGRIHEIFMSNNDLFLFAHEHTYNDKTYVFTHAGINNEWLKFIKKWAEYRLDKATEVGIALEKRDEDFFLDCIDFDRHKDNVVKLLNSMKAENSQEFFRFYGMFVVSRYRGGLSYFASPIWSDINDFKIEDSLYDKCYQVFAHTITYPNGQYSYEVGDKFAMLDASQGFTIDENGKIEPVDASISEKNLVSLR